METIRIAKNPDGNVALPMLPSQNEVLDLPFSKNLGLDPEKEGWATSSAPFPELSRPKVKATLQAWMEITSQTVTPDEHVIVPLLILLQTALPHEDKA